MGIMKVTLPAIVSLDDFRVGLLGWSPDAVIEVRLVLRMGDVDMTCDTQDEFIELIRAYVNSQPVKV